jgi:hypothetical protein
MSDRYTWKRAAEGKMSEFEVQAELYHRFRQLPNCTIRGEVIVALDAVEGGKCRFDLVVFGTNGDPICIVEVKNASDVHRMRDRHSRKPTNQISKYEKYGYPLIMCYGQEEIDSAVLEVTKLVIESCFPSLVPSVASPSYSPSTHSPSPIPVASDRAHTHEACEERQQNKPIKTSPQRYRKALGGETNLELFGKQEQLSSKTMQDFMAVWNGTFVLPKIVSMKGRERVLHELMKDEFFRDNWREGIKRVAASKFCRGHNRQGTGTRSWYATVDWFLQTYVLPRVLEGVYDDGKDPQVTPDDQKFTAEEF